MITNEQKAPPGPSHPYIVDAVLEMQNKGFLGFFGSIWRQYGDIARIQIGSRNMFFAMHPEHVRYISITNRQNYDKAASYDVVRKLLVGDGLLTSTGDKWRRQRRLMAPFFTPRSVEQYLPIMIQDGLTLVRRWEELAVKEDVVEMSNEMMRVTASIILRTMFSMESDTEVLKIKDAVETMIQFTYRSEANPIHLPQWAPLPANLRYNKARNLVHHYIDSLISRRRAMPEAEWPDDLLSKLMLAREEETGQAMPDKQLKDEAITIFFAGHETTARTLTFMWYALSQNPQVEARLHAEIDAVIGDRTPTVDDLKQLHYTSQVIKETLRLYPPAPVYVRDAIQDDVIDGYAIPTGARVMLFPYFTHRHPDFWQDAEAFDPDRWLPEAEAARHPYAYHPFAAGQRICIGNNFSLFESQVLVALLARRFAPRLLPGHCPQVEMAGTLYSKNGMPMTIYRRG
jgi:cytochrome P450